MAVSDLQALKDELDSVHPITGAYNPDHQLAANQLNERNCPRDKDTMSGDEVFAATEVPEFNAVGQHKQLIWLSFCSRSEIDPFGTANVNLVIWVFGSSSLTLMALRDKRKETVSRATKLSLGRVRAGDVARARAL